VGVVAAVSGSKLKKLACDCDATSGYSKGVLPYAGEVGDFAPAAQLRKLARIRSLDWEDIRFFLSGVIFNDASLYISFDLDTDTVCIPEGCVADFVLDDRDMLINPED